MSTVPHSSSIPASSELGAALRGCKGALIAIAAFSGIINILMLTGSIFMLEVYDRVLPSRSVATLAALALLAGLLYAAQGLLEYIRGRLFSHIGVALDEAVGGRLFASLIRLPLVLGCNAERQQPLRDLDSLRSFLSSNGPSALFDLPWIPVYLLIIYACHPLLGVMALVGAIVLVALAVVSELTARAPSNSATHAGQARASLADACRRNAEVVAAMGMERNLASKWQASHQEFLVSCSRVGNLAGSLGTLSKTLRFMLQSAILGVGAWLVIDGRATPGIIIASSILFGRALSPVDTAIANAKGLVGARQSWTRLTKLLTAFPARPLPLQLPPPQTQLSVNAVTVLPPAEQNPTVRNVSFKVNAGKAIGIVGPSGSGKSCLARALVGAWRPVTGNVELDGAGLDQWSPDALGRHVGYLPQDVEMFAGTVADNISRFAPDASPADIVAAAKAAGVHDLITSLPNGYQTQVGGQGTALSAGQRQRIALARALYGDPFLVVLDEPNSNLDIVGEQALIQAIGGVKARGGVVVLIAHRPNALAAMDSILVMQNGQAQQLVPGADTRSRLRVASSQAAHPELQT